MQRYNLFQQPHFALQDALFNSARSLQLNAGKAITALTIQAVTATVELGNQILMAKENHLLPAVDAYEPAVVDAVKQKHALVVADAQKVQEAIALERANLPALFAPFVNSQLACMLKSEAWLNPVLWYYYTDKELQQMEPLLMAIPMHFNHRRTA